MSKYHYWRKKKLADENHRVKALGSRTYGYDFANDGRRETVDYKRIQKFLDSRVGYSWNKTYSMLCKKYDRRSYIGHEAREYIKYMIGPSRWTDYFIDGQGILRKRKN